jgi:Fur family transcriptional regulator, ferric uptake regulator
LNEVLLNNSRISTSPDKEQLLRTLRTNGIKLTKQRRLLIDIITEKEFHSCKDIFQYASCIDPTIGVATIYRMVKTLENLGVVNRKINIMIGE